ncbi:MAG: cytochrome b5 domain-containing protein [Candidatus Omnitrophica bacterium]|nr:cytochrome b5 domain-containing protein [Candidatus Omnitrophota bacterium]
MDKRVFALALIGIFLIAFLIFFSLKFEQQTNKIDEQSDEIKPEDKKYLKEEEQKPKDQEQDYQKMQKEYQTTEQKLTKYTLEEVAKHNKANDCWMIINQKVYNLTDFIASGEHNMAIVEGCGKNATTLFFNRTREDGTKIGSGTPHSKKAQQKLSNYYIGEVLN